MRDVNSAIAEAVTDANAGLQRDDLQSQDVAGYLPARQIKNFHPRSPGMATKDEASVPWESRRDILPPCCPGRDPAVHIHIPYFWMVPSDRASGYMPVSIRQSAVGNGGIHCFCFAYISDLLMDACNLIVLIEKY